MADLSYRIDVKDNGSATLRTFSGNLDRTKKSAKEAGSSMGGMATAAKGLLGVLAVGKLAQWGKQIIDMHGAYADLGRAVGVSTENIAGFSYAAKMNGSSAEAFATASKILAKNIQAAANDTGEAKDYFDAFGISVKNVDGTLKSADEVMFEVADSFKAMKDGTEKAAAAQKIFGKSGLGMIEVLNQGSESLRIQVKEGAALAGVNEKNTLLMEEAGDAIDRLKTAGEGAFSALIVAAAPFVNRLADASKYLAENIRLMREQEETSKTALKNETAALASEIALATQRIKLGDKLSEGGQKALKQKQEQLKSMYEELGLSDKEAELMTLKANLRVKENLNKQRGAELDTEATANRIAQIEQELKAEEKKKTIVASTLNESLAGDDRKKEAESREKKFIDALAKEARDRLAREQKIADQQEKIREEAKEADLEYIRSVREAQESIAVDRMSDQQKELYALNQRKEELAKSLGESKSLQDWYHGEVAKINVEYEKNALDEKDKLRKESEDAYIELQKQTHEAQMYNLSTIASVVGNLNATLAATRQAEVNKINERYEFEREKIESNAKLDLVRAGNNQAQKEAIAERTAQQLQAIEDKKVKQEMDAKKKTFELEKALSIVEATMNGAVGVTNALATGIPPLNFILASTIAGLTAAQIGVISSQKLASGGEAVGRNALVTLNESGQEGVLNPKGYKSVGRDFLNAANFGATKDELASMLGKNKGSVNLSIQVTGFLDQRGINDVLVPAINKAMRSRR